MADVFTLPASQPSLEGTFTIYQGNYKMIVLNAHGGTSYSTTINGGIGGYQANTLDIFRLTTIDGLNDADVVDSREDRAYFGELPFASTYGGRNIVFSGQIEAGNLARMRQMSNLLKESMAPRYYDFFSSGGGKFFSSTPNRLVYAARGASNVPVNGSNESRTAYAEIYGYVVDFTMAEVQSSSRFWRQFQFTFRCPDPRWYVPQMIHAEKITQGTGTFSVTNEGNILYEPVFYYGDYLGDGGGAAWSTNSSGFTLKNNTTDEEIKVNTTLSGLAGTYVTLDSFNRRIFSSSIATLLSSVSMATYQKPWITLAPGSNSLTLTATSTSGTPKLTFFLRHTFI
jgi:hypothetical protein